MKYEKKILDHGYVKLINHMGGDEDIVEAARMSTNKGFISWDPYAECSLCGRIFSTDEERRSAKADSSCPHKLLEKPTGDTGFLEFLLENRHTSPFEQVELAIEVQAPIMVYREWHRHRTQSYNELSARYTQMPNLHYVPEASRLKAVASKNKQEISVGDKVFDDLDEALRLISEEQEEVYHHYEQMLEHGVPKEVARINTPVSRYSRMRAKTDLWNWLHFLNLRMRPNAQWEIRQYANSVAEIIEQLFPRTYWLFEEYMLHSVSFSRTEMKALRAFFESRPGVDNLADIMAGQVESKTDGVKRVKKLLEKLGSSAA